MTFQLSGIRTTRKWLTEMIGELSLEQLNIIPPGFNNNIVWNYGHMIAAQHGICYVRAGVPTIVDEKIINDFKTGTKPGEPVSTEQWQNLKLLMISTIDSLEEDLRNHAFNNYETWSTRYGVEMTNIEDAIRFLPFHEGMHIGYIIALKRVVLR